VLGNRAIEEQHGRPGFAQQSSERRAGHTGPDHDHVIAARHLPTLAGMRGRRQPRQSPSSAARAPRCERFGHLSNVYAKLRLSGKSARAAAAARFSRA
jgi:hypothetical protein